MGDRRISRGQPRPYRKGGAQGLPNFGDSLLFMYTPFDEKLSNLTS